jgi:hypothetical protein
MKITKLLWMATLGLSAISAQADQASDILTAKRIAIEKRIAGANYYNESIGFSAAWGQVFRCKLLIINHPEIRLTVV